MQSDVLEQMNSVATDPKGCGGQSCEGRLPLEGSGRGAGVTPAPQCLLLSLSLQPASLILRPGPIHAVDGDQGINQRILYSIMMGECGPDPCFSLHPARPPHLGLRKPQGTCHVGRASGDPSPQATGGSKRPSLPTILAGQEDGTFAIDTDSGNLTMTRSVPSPKTFSLLVKVGALARPPWPFLSLAQAVELVLQGPRGSLRPPPPQGEQADHARYSVTWVTIEARNATGSPPHFPESRYHGTVARGSGAGVEVKDATAPAQPLRIWAQDPDFPVGSSPTAGGSGGHGGSRARDSLGRV